MTEVASLLGDLVTWARSRDDVVGMVLVGSWARGAARPDSDVDVVVLAPEPEALADGDWFLAVRPGAQLVRRQAWGPVLERRLRLPSGLIVELGLVDPAWAALPVDEGTARVLRDGCRVLHDPVGVLERAVSALPGEGVRSSAPRATGP